MTKKRKFGTFCDVEALAGHWDLAAVQENFQIVSRLALPGGFGNECIESNRDLLGQFPIQTSPPEDWEPVECDFLAGTPPCSGWSNLNTSKFRSTGRGIDSDIHECTWALVKFAARCTGSDGLPGPQIVAFESVQQAFTIGRPLMEQYYKYLNQQTGGQYKLTHVLMSGASVGSASERRRYFWVAHRIPFGVGLQLRLNGPVIVRERIDDLREQPTGEWPDVHPTSSKLDLEILCMERAGWVEGMTLRDACFILMDKHKLPQAARDRWFDSNMCWRNFAGPKVVRANEPMSVITGGSRSDFTHWALPRFLTIHELARLMDLPDEWIIPGNSINRAVAWLGKAAPVASCRWISYWVRQSLLGKPGPIQANEIGVIDITHDWKKKAMPEV